MFSFGMLTARAESMARRSRGLPSGSPPPALAATVISRMILVQAEARRLSVTAFLRLICFHLLWPAMTELLAAYWFRRLPRGERPLAKHKPRGRRRQRDA